ncbi:MAG: DUF2283 domain-containing protein [Candidatus Promineifilaceae bacterium]|nr:DUF2283 domain-containing protein [Candidatus Promineifilaceae bacterium]
MVFRYFAETDMLYVELKKGVAVESEEAAPHIVLDFDELNRVIGIEIEEASKVIDLHNWEFSSLPIATLIMNQKEEVSL